MVIVDDQRLFTRGLRGLVEMLPGVEVVGVAYDGEEGVALCRERGVLTEASGGLALATARAVAETGVDYLAIGALTHSAPVLDLGLDLRLETQRMA